MTESVMNQSTKFIPPHTPQPTPNRLKPARSRTFNVHRGNSDPQRWLDPVHVKVIHTTGAPQLRIFTCEHREIDFGQLAVIGMVQIEVRCVVTTRFGEVCRLNVHPLTITQSHGGSTPFPILLVASPLSPTSSLRRPNGEGAADASAAAAPPRGAWLR
jgi:hypothetical protein